MYRFEKVISGIWLLALLAIAGHFLNECQGETSVKIEKLNIAVQNEELVKLIKTQNKLLSSMHRKLNILSNQADQQGVYLDHSIKELMAIRKGIEKNTIAVQSVSEQITRQTGIQRVANSNYSGA